jgi:hypothetical protein
MVLFTFVANMAPARNQNIYLSLRYDEDFVVEWTDGTVTFYAREEFLGDLQELVNSADGGNNPYYPVPRTGWDGWELFQGWQGRAGWEGFQGQPGWNITPVYRSSGNGFWIEVAKSVGNAAIGGIGSSVFSGCVIM